MFAQTSGHFLKTHRFWLNRKAHATGCFTVFRKTRSAETKSGVSAFAGPSLFPERNLLG